MASRLPNMQQLAGLFDRKRNHSVPLTGIETNAIIVETFAKVDVKLSFENDLNDPLEVTLRFPMDNKVAVCSLTAMIGGQKIVGKVQVQQDVGKHARTSNKSLFVLCVAGEGRSKRDV